MNKKLILITIVISWAVILPLMTIGYIQDQYWPVPKEYQELQNPIPADEESVALGKVLYNQHCKACHGKEGWGDGPKSAQLDVYCGDFSSDEFKAQSDGVLFYKSYIGKDEMPNYEKKIPDEEDIWHIVNYMKTF